MDTAKDRVIDVFSGAAPTYDSVGPRHFTYFARRLVEFADIGPGSHVLDVATGTGTVLLAVAERLAGTGRVVGVDVTEAMLERAAAEVSQLSVQNAELRVMDAGELDFPTASFDDVLCSFAFLSLPHRERALSEFHRVLKPGGRVGLLDAFGWFFQHDPRWRWQEEVLRSYGALSDARESELQPGDLAQEVRAAAFDAVEMIEDAYELVFTDEDEWWAWGWSHGSRSILETVPETKLDELKQVLTEGLEACKEPDGLIHGTLRAVLARGDKPR